MTEENLTQRIHELDVTLWVGKGGIEPVVEELSTQVEEHDLVKVKFLPASRQGRSTEELAVELAEAADATIVQTRGHTAVFER